MRSREATRSGRAWGQRCGGAGLLVAFIIVCMGGPTAIVALVAARPVGVVAGIAVLFVAARSLGGAAGRAAAQGPWCAVGAGVLLALACVTASMAAAGFVEALLEAIRELFGWSEHLRLYEVNGWPQPEYSRRLVKIAEKFVLVPVVLTVAYGCLPAFLLGLIFARGVRVDLRTAVEDPVHPSRL
jgi:hypothetical protein